MRSKITTLLVVNARGSFDARVAGFTDVFTLQLLSFGQFHKRQNLSLIPLPPIYQTLLPLQIKVSNLHLHRPSGEALNESVKIRCVLFNKIKPSIHWHLF